MQNPDFIYTLVPYKLLFRIQTLVVVTFQKKERFSRSRGLNGVRRGQNVISWTPYYNGRPCNTSFAYGWHVFYLGFRVINCIALGCCWCGVMLLLSQDNAAQIILLCSPNLWTMISKSCSFELLLYLVFVSFEGHDFMSQIISLK